MRWDAISPTRHGTDRTLRYDPAAPSSDCLVLSHQVAPTPAGWPGNSALSSRPSYRRPSTGHHAQTLWRSGPPRRSVRISRKYAQNRTSQPGSMKWTWPARPREAGVGLRERPPVGRSGARGHIQASSAGDGHACSEKPSTIQSCFKRICVSTVGRYAMFCSPALPRDDVYHFLNDGLRCRLHCSQFSYPAIFSFF